MQLKINTSCQEKINRIAALAAVHNLRNCSSYHTAAAGTGLTSGQNYSDHHILDSFRSRRIVAAGDKAVDKDFAGIRHLAFRIAGKVIALAAVRNPNNS